MCLIEEECYCKRNEMRSAAKETEDRRIKTSANDLPAERLSVTLDATKLRRMEM